MTSAQYYRDEAERCRGLAAGNPTSSSAPRWRQLASEYELLAESMALAPSQRQSPPPTIHQHPGKERRSAEAG